MTIKERVYASRILEKAERNAAYAKAIGLSYSLDARTEAESGGAECCFALVDKGKGKHTDEKLQKRREEKTK